MRIAVAALCVVTAAGGARGEPTDLSDRFAGRTIESIRVEKTGPGRLDRGFVESHTRVRPGAALAPEVISRDVRDLLRSGRFTDVAVHAEEVEGGVRLTYSLRNKLRLAGPPVVRGARRFGESRVLGWLDLREGSWVDEHTAGARAARIRKEYREERYPDARVEWDLRVTDEREGLASLTVDVTEGMRARVKKVVFGGARAIAPADYARAIGLRAWYNPVRWFSRLRYDADQLRDWRAALRDHAYRRGFLDVRVSEPDVETLPDGHIRVRFGIEEGREYRFGSATFTGLSVFDESALHSAVAARAGAPADADAVDQTRRGLLAFYGSRGYADAAVRIGLEPRLETGTADVRIAVSEGGPVYIRNIRIAGNSRTRDEVVRRELLVSPGELYDTVKVDRSERRLRNLGFFSSVRTRDESTLLDDHRDLVFDLEEKRTGQLMVGAGFSSVDRLIGYAEVSQGNFDIRGWPNFTGGGQKLKLHLEGGGTRKEYTLSFVEPWFMERRLSLGADLFYSDVDYDDYSLERVGGALTLSHALPGPNRISYRYGLKRTDLTDISDTNAYVYADAPDTTYFFAQEEDYVDSSLRVTVTHDTRDNPFVATHGTLGSLFAEASGGPLGFDLDRYGLGGRVTQYVPLWFGHVLSVHGRYEVADEFGDSRDLPIGERLFLGGGRTVRGFKYRYVGPKALRSVVIGDDESVYAKPIGGRSLALASVEYILPVVKGLRAAAFYDTGNVWSDPFELDVSDRAESAGVGLRLDVPGFPIRIDRAWSLRKDDPYTRTDAWVFWIGFDR